MRLIMPVMLLRFLERLTYANVAATLALFISLGGASYAAVSLPTGSVGQRQLRAGAVTPRALGFPLAARSFKESAPLVLAQTLPCPGDSTCVVKLTEGTPLGSLSLVAPGEIQLSAVVGVQDEGPAGTSAQVQLSLFEDGRSVASVSLEIAAGQHEQIPMQALTTGKRGANPVGFAALAHYGPQGHTGVSIYPVSIIATALPQS